MYRKELSWKEFDESVFGTFENAKITGCVVCPFGRQKNANGWSFTCLSDEIQIFLNAPSLEIKPEHKVLYLFGQEQFDLQKKAIEEETPIVKFPYYAKMCPFPQDKAGRIPIVKAVDMLNWIDRTFLGSKSPMEYLKEVLKSDTFTLCKLEQTIPIVTIKSKELLDKLFPEEKGEKQTDAWTLGNRANFREQITRVHQQLIQELLLNEKVLHKDINIIPLYTNEVFHKAVLCVATELVAFAENSVAFSTSRIHLSLIHICRCRRYAVCRSRWSPYH
eukprot:TRINITY_DN7252_c0_g1_i7.p1 TRINITY_DN7252_c0_g1~~TRINITY_DN7252_c0_g1_i7.p1  ORF type:complete len:276 (-),score=77.69 TRINITY_DN7252_c0_g1_i7:17-844(-)